MTAFIHTFCLLQLQMRISELETIKKERTQLETQVRQLTQKLSDPSTDSNTLRAKLAHTEKQMERLQKELVESRHGKRAAEHSCPKCEQVRSSYTNDLVG